jgi:hypothetical protein
VKIRIRKFRIRTRKSGSIKNLTDREQRVPRVMNKDCVAAPDHFDMDLDPTIHFDIDPDPTISSGYWNCTGT